MCGVFGIYDRSAPDRDVARLTFFGLYALQHRGQESAGIAVADGEPGDAMKDMGLVSQVFDEPNCARCAGDWRSATRATRPPARRVGERPAGRPAPVGRTASRSATTATWSTRPSCARSCATRASGSQLDHRHRADRALIARPRRATWDERSPTPWPQMRGRLRLVVLTERRSCSASATRAASARSSLGRLDDGWVLASETCALDTIGARARSARSSRAS